MVVIMSKDCTDREIQGVIQRIQKSGLGVHISRGVERTIIGVIGDVRKLLPESLEVMPGVDRVVRILHPFKLASRDFQPEPTIVKVGNVAIGAGEVVVIAGPCAVEDETSLFLTAEVAAKAGASLLRGGAFKPRTSPYSFQGLGEEGLKLLAEARRRSGLPVVTEVLTPEDVELVSRYADVLQIGARNMQNSALLQEVGRSRKPVLLKRGMMASIEEWLMSAEYILSNGNNQVILCERGIRTFEKYTRNTLDISAVPIVRQLSHLPVIVDPSHGTGKRELVLPMAKAAIVAGADGLMIEVHPCPDKALSDGPQSLDFPSFENLMAQIKSLCLALSKEPRERVSTEEKHFGT